MDIRWCVPTALLAALAAAAQAAERPPAFPSQVQRVTVDVTVTDADGQPVRGLTQADFVVRDNGVPQALLQFEAVDLAAAAADAEAEAVAAPEAVSAGATVVTNLGPEPPGRNLVVVWDDLNITASTRSADAAREALATFLRVQARSGDRVTLAPTSGGARWTGRVPDDRDDLLAALKALQARRLPDLQHDRIADHEAMLIERRNDTETIRHVLERYKAMGVLDANDGLVRSLASETYRLARQRNEATLAALERALLASAGRGRSTVLLVSEGFIQDERLEGFRRATEAARQANAVIYFLDARGLRPAETGGVDVQSVPDMQNLTGYNALALEYADAATGGSAALAADSGGFTIRNTNDLASGLARISREGRSFYLLGFEPSDKRQDGKFRKLQVEVRRPGVKVTARKGYYAPGGKDVRLEAGALDPEVRSALDSGAARRDLPLRATAYLLDAASEGRVHVLLVAEADPEALSLEDRGASSQGALESFSTVAARDSGQVAERNRLLELALTAQQRLQLASTWLPVSHAYELPPGSYQARIAVRDRRSRRVGSVGMSFQVPDPHELRVTTPVLTDTLRRAAEAGVAPVPVPIARRSFAAGSRLVCSFSVEGAQPRSRVLVTYEVRRGDGSVVTRTPPTPLRPDASDALRGSFNLGAQNPGRYEVRLQVRDEASGAETEARVPFEVGPAGL